MTPFGDGKCGARSSLPLFSVDNLHVKTHQGLPQRILLPQSLAVSAMGLSMTPSPGEIPLDAKPSSKYLLTGTRALSGHTSRLGCLENARYHVPWCSGNSKHPAGTGPFLIPDLFSRPSASC